MRRAVFGVLVVSGLLTLLACGGMTQEQKENTRRVEEAYRFSVSTLRTVNTNELAAMTFQEIGGLGGDAIDWLYASAPLEKDWAPIVGPDEKKAWSVVVTQVDVENWKVEGFGEDLAEPIMAVDLVLKPKLPPGR